MNGDSFLTTKCTSFSFTQNKLRSRSIQYKQLDISQTNPIQREVSEKQKEQRKSIQITSNLHQNVNIILLFTKPIIEQLTWRQSELYMNQFKIQLSYIVDSGNLQQLGAIVCMTADILLKIKDYNNACYYYNQYRIFNTLTKNHAEKAKALIGLANCATEVKLNSEALILLKKALQYAWLSKEYELQIYEKFALNYYYLGQSEEQYYFHERGLLGILESDESPIKQFSCESLRDQMKKNNVDIKTLCPQLLNYMNLPVLSRNELLSSNPNSIRGVQVKKQVVYTVTEQVEILLQKNDEFQHQINTPKHQKLVKSQNGKRADGFRVVSSSLSSYSKERRNYDLTDNTIYKLPYEVQVSNRLRYPYIPEDINAKLREQLRNTNRTQKFGLRNKVILNHQHREDMHYRKNGACMQRQLYAIFQHYSHLFI
ncbi:unnamed protein product (macronuclear) [Paramecium tetraurelia]|uniref:Uncharacterized protein n=1 Tax=Paramecium tetraurelia TaxID=5888 RepID=A0DQ37_PARTE|nr:uncharacterized protein GSPATT00002554001 [Paramecium tetraurelia]CAK85154.1 unnamed protein product [Paramecium tetraurelia]|eukprot:XP_001452551.1 hypothetical protein (macronuclear) [Paramecium tetraurelia strain d4-2]